MSFDMIKFSLQEVLAWVLFITVVFVAIDAITYNYIFDEDELVNNYYQVFLNEYGALVPGTYQCDKQSIIDGKLYEIKNRDYVTYFCTNGKFVVYLFDKGLGRSVLLANWHHN